MDPILASILGIIALIILLALGFHVAIALGLVGVVGLWWLYGLQSVAGLLFSIPYTQIASFGLSAVPLFILMGHFAIHGGVGEDMYQAAYRLMGRTHGSLAMATALAAALFGAAPSQ